MEPQPTTVTDTGEEREIDWDAAAADWVRWVRTPGHDAYGEYSGTFFQEMVPAPGGLTVEVGCGEGRVSRDLRDRGHRVVALDRSRRLLRSAAEADPAMTLVRANAARLPIADGTADLVVAYNVLMDVADLDGTVAEMARITSPGGRVAVCITHPFQEAGHVEDSTFVVTGTYFGRRPFEETLERNGLSMTFRGWSTALQDYAVAFERAGLLIESLREPAAEPPSPWQRMPLFLMLRLVKRSEPATAPLCTMTPDRGGP